MTEIAAAPVAPELMRVNTSTNGGKVPEQPYDRSTGLFSVEPMWLERSSDGAPKLAPLEASGLEQAVAAARQLSAGTVEHRTDHEDYGFEPNVREIAQPFAVLQGPGDSWSAARLTPTPPTAVAAGHNQRIEDMMLRSWRRDRPDRVSEPRGITSFELFDPAVQAVVTPDGALPSAAAK